MPSLHERYQGCSQQGLSVQGAALQFHLQLSGKSRTHTNPVLVDHRNELALEICGGGFCRRLVRLHHVALVRWFDHKYTKLLPDLVDTTAKNFTISEISADKGYGSVKNYKAIQRHGAVPYIAFKSIHTGRAEGLWKKMFHYFQFRRDEFLAHYHKRNNVESTFSMIKAKFGDHLRSKTDAAMVNEVLCKIICHNICCLIQEAHELGITTEFWANQSTPR